VPYNLLLADDSVTIQRVIELTFADEDVTVVAVGDGDQAIERLEAAPPDIVLADIGMPGKNGYEVALYMRRSPKLAHIPVVLLTGAFEPVDQARANDAGCDGVLAKPFEPQLVIGRVKELLAKARRAPHAPVAGSREPVDAGTVEPPPPPSMPAPAADSIRTPPVANQRPVTPFVDPPAAGAAAAPAASTELNDYFDRLDAAFSNVNPSPAPDPAAAPVTDPPTPPGTGMDWFTPTARAAASAASAVSATPAVDDAFDLPLSNAAPEPPIAVLDDAMMEPPVEIPGDRLSAIEESAPLPSAARALELPLPDPPPLPLLPDAFAALLAAEHGDTGSAASALWPVDATPAPPSPPVVTDAMIEEIVRRVLDRLSETVVREAIADVASSVAERLVLEEIARIRAAIK
jgi:CheY-like chemotaxis protein